MRVLKLGTLRLWMTKKRLEESQVHLQIKSCKTTLTASKFRDLHEWFEEEETRLVRKSVVWARKHAPVFALGQICAICGEDLDMDTFGTKEIYVRVVGLRPLGVEDPQGKIWNGGLGFRLRKLTVKEEDKLGQKYRSV
ncbi:MAG TPA: hypothetical protein VFA89_20495 [Terriglobales bacterium]|nr:hypothetical protein [Terriglobales bacterium]